MQKHLSESKSACAASRVPHASRWRTVFGAAAALSLVLAAPSALAAPMMELDKLPVSEGLLTGLRGQGMTDDEIADFIVTLAQIDVYPDHENPRDGASLADPLIPKKFYSSPHLAPSPTRHAVGAELFATHALEILNAADDLSASFDYRYTEWRRASVRLEELDARASDAHERLLEDDLTDIERASLEVLAENLTAEVAELTDTIEELVEAGANGMAQLPTSLQRSVVHQFVLQMSRLGVAPTTAEAALLASNDTSEIVLGMGQLRARAAGGQFGIRQVIVEGGYTPKQREVLATYFELRPDVRGLGLPVQRLFVRSVAQTFINQDGAVQERTGPMLLRGVNLGTKGKCGAARTCNVVVEYTDLGARSASRLSLGSSPTPTLLPVTFEGEVNVRVPDFVGGVDCNLRTGWMANGRADVRDGAIIYNGDLTDQLHFNSFANGGCDFTIEEGSASSAFYTTLNELNQHYIRLRYEREQKAKADKDAYEQRLRDELSQHQRNASARRRGGWFGSLVSLVTSNSISGRLFGFVVGQARGFYWHTTRLNTSSTDDLEFHQRYSIRNLTELQTFSFDGFPLVCSAGEGLERRLVACPDAELSNADTESGAAEDVCQEDDFTCD